MVFTSCHTNLNLKKDSWLIDSGANSHIACSLHSFTESKPLDNHFVTLPNHTKIRALSIGTVQLSDSLFLYNVLYIPQFHVNLLSVSALLHSSPYSLQFSNSSFIIQDLLSKKVIGRGNQLGGLYVLQSGSFPSLLPSLVSHVTAETWHARLGHLSNKVFNKVCP